MKKILSLSFIIVIAIACNNNNISKKNEVASPYDFMYAQRAFPYDKIDTESYKNAVQWRKDHLSATKNVTNFPAWEFIGPTNIGGRITDVEIPHDQPQTYYVGAASGGVFKTVNAGNDWQNIFDNQSMLSIGDIAISKQNTQHIWVGTGEPNAGGGSLAYDGNGIFYSSNGGNSWLNKGLDNSGSISKIIINPTDENIIFAGAMGHLFVKDNYRGVYRSTDGGNTWEQKLFVSDSTGVIDMAINPVNTNIVYAVTWERIRRPGHQQYGGETSGIFRSIDGGDNWTELTNGLPQNPTEKGRISIDISQSNPNVLYAFYANASGSEQGTYKTTDGGNTWTGVSNLNDNVPYHWWFGGVFIDPTDENIVYHAAFDMHKSTNGGGTWSTVFNNVHVDQHAMAFNSQVPGEILIGNDGGLYKSTNSGLSYTKINNLPITQIYRMYVDYQNPDKIYAGTQDNSTPRTQTGGINNWQILYGGDGMQPLVDPGNSNVIYAQYQRGHIAKSTNNGNSFFPVINGISGTDRKNWNAPLVFDPANAQILYFGSNKVYKTTNGAGNWTAISPDLTNGSHSGNVVFGTIYSIDVSVLNSNVIYAGTDDGNVWLTQNGGINWIKISNTLPQRWVTKVLASNRDAGTIYVSYSGYRFGENIGHIYKSDDYGGTWQDITGNLPDIPVNDIAQDDFGNLFIATDMGVLVSGSSGTNWQLLGQNIPSVVVTDLFIHRPTGYLYAGTFGRSAFKINVSNNLLNIPSETDTSFEFFPNPVKNTLYLKGNIDDIESLRIVDLQGKIWLHKKYISNGINVSQLPAGIYLIQISGKHIKSTGRFIKN